MNVLAPAATYFDQVLRAISSQHSDVSRVSLLHSTTGFGHEVASGATMASRELGLELHATASRPWRAAAFVGAGVDDVLATLGPAREGLLGPAEQNLSRRKLVLECASHQQRVTDSDAAGSSGDVARRMTQWLARVAEPPDEGPAADWFVATFRDAVGAEPAYPAAAAFAAGVLAARCLRDAGTAKDEAVLGTTAQLDVQTLFGHFHLDPDTGLQVGSEILVVQWQAGERRAVWPLPKAERQILPLRGR